MSHFDTVLQDLQEKVARKRKLENVMTELRAQRSELFTQVDRLDALRIKEQADVDKLEGGSLAAFFYNVIGKMDERLDKEREEAYAAAVKYDAAARELEAVKADIRKCDLELRELQGVEHQYVQALQEKSDAIKASNSQAGQQILQLETSISILKSRQKENREALGAGSMALTAAEDALERLGKASGLATWDLLGGGLLVDLAKHEALDEAQSCVEELQRRLRRFKIELSDVSMHGDFHVNLDGFTRTADFIFDGLFVDWTVSDQISQSKSQVENVRRKIASVLPRLEEIQRNLDAQIAAEQKRLDELVKNTVL